MGYKGFDSLPFLKAQSTKHLGEEPSCQGLCLASNTPPPQKKTNPYQPVLNKQQPLSPSTPQIKPAFCLVSNNIEQQTSLPKTNKTLRCPWDLSRLPIENLLQLLLQVDICLSQKLQLLLDGLRFSSTRQRSDMTWGSRDHGSMLHYNRDRHKVVLMHGS